MAYSIIASISQGFDASESISDHPNTLTRYYGGHSRISHPYVNGYWQLYISPPAALFNKITIPEATNVWFHATAEGFTPPSRNLNKADLPAQGGVGSSWVTGQSLQRTFSITHREYREMPVRKLYQLWTGIIAPHVGVSELYGNEWAGTSYKGHAFVVLTKPVGDGANSWTLKGNTVDPADIEEVFYFDGVWPENEPTDALAQDIGSNDLVQYTINFSFDGWFLDKSDDGVVEKAIEVLNGWSYQDTYDRYTKDLDKFKKGLCETSLI